MSLLYGDNFQSYAVGAGPPYGDLVYFSGVIPIKIVADSAGLFGQTKNLELPPNNSLSLPAPIFTGAGPYYQQATIYQYIKLKNSTDVQGSAIQFWNANSSPFDNSLSGIRILQDGTLAIVAEFTGSISLNSKVSDYSLLCNKWYLLRIDISFGTNLTHLEVLDCKIYVNGVVVVSISNIVTTIPISGFDHLYFNHITFTGAGLGMEIGGIWIYDTIQSSTFYPNPGTPSARLNQGVIELIKKRSVAKSNNTRIYEA